MPTIKLKPQTRQYEIRTDSFKPEDKTIDLIWSRGAMGLRIAPDGTSYYESLSMDPADIDMSYLQSGRMPFLDAHLDGSCRSILGVIKGGKVEDSEGLATVLLSDRDDVRGINGDIQKGIICNTSVRYRVYRYDLIGDIDGIPHLLARKWMPREVSACPMGFDDGAYVLRSGDDVIEANECEFPEEFLKRVVLGAGVRADANELNPCVIETNKETGANMPPENTNPQTTPGNTGMNVEQERKEAADAATASERNRSAQIMDSCRTAGLPLEFARKLVGENKSVEQAGTEIIAEMARIQGAAAAAKPAVVTPGTQDEKITKRDGVEEAILHRCAPKDHPITDKGRQFAGMSLVRMSELFAGPGPMNNYSVAKRAMATSDLPDIFAAVANKRLRRSYEVSPRTFQAFVVPQNLPDFKEMKLLQFGDAPDLEKIAEDGDIQFGSIGEGKEVYKVLRYAKGLRITLEAIVNDDLGALNRIPALFGAASARLESKIVYDILTGTGNAAQKMGDGKALFDKDFHFNTVAAGTAFDEDNLDALRSLMVQQKTLDKKDFIGLMPKFLVHGPALTIKLRKMLFTGVVPSAPGNVSPFEGAFVPIEDARIANKAFFLVADPAVIDTIYAGYIEGMSGPETTSERDFDSSGLKIKCEHTFGAKAVDWRAFAKNPGV